MDELREVVAVLRQRVDVLEATMRDAIGRVDKLEEVNAEERGREEERARRINKVADDEDAPPAGRKVSVQTMILAALTAVAALPPILEKLGELLR